MRPPPNAKTHGDGVSTTATFFDFTGMSSATAGAAAANASAAHIATLFFSASPFRFVRPAPIQAPLPLRSETTPAAIDPYATGRALRAITHSGLWRGKAKWTAVAAFLGVSGLC